MLSAGYLKRYCIDFHEGLWKLKVCGLAIDQGQIH